MNVDTLVSLGISKKAAKMYLATLSLGTVSLMELAKKAGVKRPTAYSYVEELLNSGFLEKVPYGKRVLYSAANPDEFLARAQSRVQAIEDVLPSLRTMHEGRQGRPKVTLLEGKEGIKRIYQEAIQAHSIRVCSNASAFEKYLHEYGSLLTDAIREQQIRVREIVVDTPQSRRSIMMYSRLCGKTHTPRAATATGIENDNMIFGNVVAFFRIHAHDLYVIRIEEKSIADTMRALFDMAWKVATPIA